MSAIQIPAFGAPITADGNAAGYVGLTATRGLYLKQQGFLSSGTQSTVAVEISDLSQPLKVGLRILPAPGLLAGKNYGNSDISAFTITDSARLDFPEQLIYNPMASGSDGTSSPQLVGTLTSAGSSVNNDSTAVPFLLTPTSRLILQGDVAFYVRTVTSSSGTVSASNGTLVPQGTEWPVTLQSTEAFVAVIPVTGTSLNVKVSAVP